MKSKQTLHRSIHLIRGCPTCTKYWVLNKLASNVSSAYALVHKEFKEGIQINDIARLE
jgi:hypothetical protein